LFKGRNGGKGERRQYLEGVTVICLVMCIESCAVGEMVGGGNSSYWCAGGAGGGRTAVPYAADMR